MSKRRTTRGNRRILLSSRVSNLICKDRQMIGYTRVMTPNWVWKEKQVDRENHAKCEMELDTSFAAHSSLVSFSQHGCCPFEDRFPNALTPNVLSIKIVKTTFLSTQNSSRSVEAVNSKNSWKWTNLHANWGVVHLWSTTIQWSSSRRTAQDNLSGNRTATVAQIRWKDLAKDFLQFWCLLLNVSNGLAVIEFVDVFTCSGLPCNHEGLNELPFSYVVSVSSIQLVHCDFLTVVAGFAEPHFGQFWELRSPCTHSSITCLWLPVYVGWRSNIVGIYCVIYFVDHDPSSILENRVASVFILWPCRLTTR